MIIKYNHAKVFFLFVMSCFFHVNTMASLDEDNNSIESTTGPHHGKLLEHGAFAIELLLEETKGSPVFKAYPYYNKKPIADKNLKITVETTRLDGEKHTYKLEPSHEYFKSKEVVSEPHSFDITVLVQYNNKKYNWSYSSYEGRTYISQTAAEKFNIKTENVTKGTIKNHTRLNGRITLDKNTISQVHARFPGVVKKVLVKLGDKVEAGQLLAVVESNESLKNYNIHSPINGTVLARNTNAGNISSTDPLFTIADLSEVWGEFHVFPSDLNEVQSGQEIKLHTEKNEDNLITKITMLLPTADPLSQTVIAIVPISNPKGKWRPGMIVTGDVLVSRKEVPLAVRTSAVQRLKEVPVVFARVDNIYEVRQLVIGDSDSEWVEVKSGIKIGTEYVTNNSYVVKADIEKSGASHDH